jgi:hypothetical protein
MKSDLHIRIEYRGRSFTLNGREIYPGKFLLKRGRSKSKTPLATTTEIFSLCRSWVAK